jgi:hypothetical protein
MNKGKPKRDGRQRGKARGAINVARLEIRQDKTRQTKRREVQNRTQVLSVCLSVVAAATRAAAINFFTLWIFDFGSFQKLPVPSQFVLSLSKKKAQTQENSSRRATCRALSLLVDIGRISSRGSSSTKVGVPKYQHTPRVTWRYPRSRLASRAAVYDSSSCSEIVTLLLS